MASLVLGAVVAFLSFCLTQCGWFQKWLVLEVAVVAFCFHPTDGRNVDWRSHTAASNSAAFDVAMADLLARTWCWYRGARTW